MNRDKKIVIAIIFGIMWFSVFSWFPKPEVKDIVRTGINLILCGFLFLGAVWSRWVTGVFSVLGSITAIAFILQVENPNKIMLLAVMLLFYAYTAFMLLNPKLLKGHFISESP